MKTPEEQAAKDLADGCRLQQGQLEELGVCPTKFMFLTLPKSVRDVAFLRPGHKHSARQISTFPQPWHSRPQRTKHHRRSPSSASTPIENLPSGSRSTPED